MGHQLPEANSHRIVVLAAGEVFGGAERQILTLLEELAEAWPEPPSLVVFHDGELARQARDKGLLVQVIGARGLIDIKAAVRLRRILRELPVSAVSLHGYRAAVYLAVCSAGLNLRVVKTEHGRPELGSQDWFTSAKTALFHWMENLATRHLNAHVAYVTADLAQHFRSAHGGLCTSVIYNGVGNSFQKESQRPPELPRDRMVLAVVGRLEYVKGCDVAIRALANPGTPKDTTLCLIGEGPDRHRLEVLAKSLSVADRVTLLGFRRNAQEYIAHADILLMPSRHEGLPYTLLEALALGTPVIASKVGGIAEILGDQEAAILVEPESASELSAAINALTSDRSLRQRLVLNGTQLVQRKFSARHMAETYGKLLCGPTQHAAAKAHS